MRILHIGTHANSGAGLGMMRLHRDLQEAGVDSRVLCLRYDGTDSEAFGFLDDPRINGRRERRPVRSVLRRLGIYHDEQSRGDTTVSDLRRAHPRVMVSTPFSRYRLDKCKLIGEADVIHLHWTSGFLDWPTFFRRVRKPVVWTLRDENPALGFWHYRSDMPETLTPELKAKDALLRNRKADILRSYESLSIASLSSEEDAFFADSGAFAGRRHLVIPNSVDEKTFVRGDGDSIRREFGIPEQDKVLVFVAQYLSEPRKGFQDLAAAVSKLGRNDLTVLCVGSPPMPETGPGVRFIPVGPVTDMSRLAKVYSASDLFVSPSKAETFGKTTTEALACGTPVVSYPNSGAKDIIGPDDGELSDDFTAKALERAIRKALSRSFDPSGLRSRVLAQFSREKVAAAYFDLYDSLIKTSSSSDGHEP